jgi:hypothetical protein
MQSPNYNHTSVKNIPYRRRAEELTVISSRRRLGRTRGHQEGRPAIGRGGGRQGRREAEDVQGSCSRTGSPAYCQSSRHPPRRWWKGAPVDVVVLQEVAGSVALLPVLLCADGGQGGSPAWRRIISGRSARPRVCVCFRVVGQGLLGQWLLGRGLSSKRDDFLE